MKAKTKAERLAAIIEAEQYACNDRIRKRVQPLLQAEADRLGKLFPAFERVLFGNGTCLVEYDSKGVLGESERAGRDYGDRKLPAAFDTFVDMCEAVAEEGPADVIPNRAGKRAGKRAKKKS